MKTPFHRSLTAAVFAAVCLAPAAFAKPKKDEQQPEQGPPGAPGKSGKHDKKGKGGQQAPAMPQNVPGNVRSHPGNQGPGPGFPSQGGPSRPGLTVVIPRPPFPPPPPPRYEHSYRRSATSSGNTVAAVQSALQRRGYYRGAVDGDAGPGTRGAILGFREDNGLGVSSRIDEPLLRALGL